MAEGGPKNYCTINFTIEASGADMETLLQQFEKYIQQDLPMSIEEGTLHKIKYEPFPKNFQKKPKSKCSCSCSCFCQFNPSEVEAIGEMLEEEIKTLPIEQENNGEVTELSFEFMDQESFIAALSDSES